MKLLLWISAAMLFIAVFSLPIGYYTLLRLLISITAGILCLIYYKSGNSLKLVLSGIIALIFNPIFPVYFGDKSIWMPVDIIIGCFFVYEAITYKSSKPIESV